MIQTLKAFELLDSRGNPTVGVHLRLNDGSSGFAMVPSGASTGSHEALELRDGEDNRYNGKGVLEAVRHIEEVIFPAVKDCALTDIGQLDDLLMKLDGSENKSVLGANAILGVSLAFARAMATHHNLPLYMYLGGVGHHKLPTPMMNILNGGAHAGNNIDIQEFMIVPDGFETFSDKLRAGSEISHALGRLLREYGYATGVGDEGGFAPDLADDEQALSLIVEAISRAGYSDEQVHIALDLAASEWVTPDGYRLPKRGRTLSSDELIDWYADLINRYPIVSLEDGLGEDDFAGWRHLTERLGDSVMLVGDDLFVTNTKRLSQGYEDDMANAILIKPNQIGSLSQTLDVMRLAGTLGYQTITSHRSGETEDAFIADLAVATDSPYIKSGAPCRGERLAKYNRLLIIEREI